MSQEYNLERVGKKMPFTMPEDFFSQMQANVLAEVAKEEQEKVAVHHASEKPHQPIVKRIYWMAASVAACVCLIIGMGYSMMQGSSERQNSGAQTENMASASMVSVDKAYDNLTSEEQLELNATYANDVYLSME